jgi:hypothetical protein
MSTLRATKAPNLLNAPRVYEAGYYDQTYRELRTYFNTLDNATSALFGIRGGDYLDFSYGSFYDTTNQTAASTTAAYAITLDTTAASNGVSIASSSQLTFAEAGLYNVQFSIQFTNSGASVNATSVWFRKNGTNIANSNSEFSIPAKHGATDGRLIAAINFFVEVAADDYLELMWATEDTGISITYLAAQSSPTRPATPSVILTVNRVSEVLTPVYV